MTAKRIRTIIALWWIAVAVGGDAAAMRPPKRSRNRRAQAMRRQQVAAQKRYQEYLKEAARRAAAIQSATSEWKQAELRYKQLKAKLRRDYLNSAQVTAAEKQRTQTRREYEIQRARVWDRLAKDRSYQRLVDERDDLQSRLDALRDSGENASEQTRALVRELTEVNGALARMKAAAVDADADASAALHRYKAAQRHLRDLKRRVSDVLAREPKLNAALADVQQARAKLVRAYVAGGKPQGKAKSPSRSAGKKKKGGKKK